MRYFTGFALWLNDWSSRWVPSAFAIACLLTSIVFLAAWLGAGASPEKCLQAWGNGFWKLLEFGMQMCLVMFTGYILAVSRPLAWLLDRVARIPKGPRSAIFLITLVSIVLGWVHWGLSIVGAAVMVPLFARQRREVDYPLLVAAAFVGLGCIWHAGLSGSVPLVMAAEGHPQQAQIGVLPLEKTVFSTFNLALLAGTVLFLLLFVPALHPRAELARRVGAEKLRSLGEFSSPAASRRRTFADLVDHTYALNLLLGLAGLAWLGWYLWAKGLKGININIVNFAFLFFGVLAHRSPAALGKAAEEGVRLVWGIVLQFPFYAGIYGIIKDTGLADQLGRLLVSLFDARSLPLGICWYSGILNYFVPSGGSKWFLEADTILKAGREVGLSTQAVVLSYMWGDMLTDMIQPFWAVPLLTAARLEFKDILGYAFVIFLAYAALVSLGFLVLGPLLLLP